MYYIWCLHGSMDFYLELCFQARNYFLRIQMFLGCLSHLVSIFSQVGHGASFYIQICPLCSNKLLDKLESTQPSVISLQQNFITMALNYSPECEWYWVFPGKKKLNSHPCLLITMASFYLQHTKVFPKPVPLPLITVPFTWNTPPTNSMGDSCSSFKH